MQEFVAAGTYCQNVVKRIEIVGSLAVAGMVAVKRLSPLATLASKVRANVRLESRVSPAG